MIRLEFQRLSEPTAEIASTIERWENDPDLVPLIRRCRSQEDQRRHVAVTVDTIIDRLQRNHIFLLYAEGKLVGECSYQIDPPQCFHKVGGTAWFGINIGEKSARHRGIGADTLRFLEEEVRLQGMKRIELGVFEFNENAHRLYAKLGYQEIGRIKDFTFRDGRMWPDIRMEKIL